MSELSGYFLPDIFVSQQNERALTFEKSRSKRYDACPDVVRLKGFEPPTYWFVASHSIQLSYSRILNRDII